MNFCFHKQILALIRLFLESHPILMMTIEAVPQMHWILTQNHILKRVRIAYLSLTESACCSSRFSKAKSKKYSPSLILSFA